jgi:hypothetical protein
MTPNDVSKITLDGHTHTVTGKTPISIAVHTGGVSTIDYADAEGNIVQGEGRTSFLVSQQAGHRYSCSCGLTFDAMDANLDSDERFNPAPAVDCPNC